MFRSYWPFSSFKTLVFYVNVSHQTTKEKGKETEICLTPEMRECARQYAKSQITVLIFIGRSVLIVNHGSSVNKVTLRTWLHRWHPNGDDLKVSLPPALPADGMGGGWEADYSTNLRIFTSTPSYAFLALCCRTGEYLCVCFFGSLKCTKPRESDFT